VAIGCGSAPEPDEPVGVDPTSRIDQRVQMAAMNQQESGDPAAAVQTYTEIIDGQPHAVDAYYARGKIYQATGNYVEAEADFNTVLRHQPRHAAAYFSRGQALQAQGEHHQALVSYTLAISVEPGKASWYYLRGKAYESLAEDANAKGDTARARELRRRATRDFNVAKKLDPLTNFAKLEATGR